MHYIATRNKTHHSPFQYALVLMEGVRDIEKIMERFLAGRRISISDGALAQMSPSHLAKLIPRALMRPNRPSELRAERLTPLLYTHLHHVVVSAAQEFRCILPIHQLAQMKEEHVAKLLRTPISVTVRVLPWIKPQRQHGCESFSSKTCKPTTISSSRSKSTRHMSSLPENLHSDLAWIRPQHGLHIRERR